MKNWEKEYNKMAELNEFFGLPYDEHTDSLIKDFISTIRENDKKEIEERMPSRRHDCGCHISSMICDGKGKTYNDCLKEVKDILNKIN